MLYYALTVIGGCLVGIASGSIGSTDWIIGTSGALLLVVAGYVE